MEDLSVLNKEMMESKNNYQDAMSPFGRFLKRGFDIVCSILGLIVMSPAFVVAYWAIKREDGGPVIFSQERIGFHGQPFILYKFRSMKVTAESDGKPALYRKGDHRLTHIGRFLREHHLDELPQLINILKGDLSICGPRPERPEIAAQYCETLPEFALRLQVKAGLTGYAQVYGKYNTSPYDKLQMDLMYIAHQGILEDLKLMLATVKVLFIPESTEGITEGETTAMGQDYPKDGTMV